MKRTIFALAVLALSLSPAAFAVDKRSSVSVFGNLAAADEKTEFDDGSSTTVSTTNATVFLSYGFLVIDSLELDLDLGTTIVDGGGATTTLMSYGFTGKYFFRPVGGGGKVLPYVKAGIRASQTKLDTAGAEDQTRLGYQAGGGLEFQLNESASSFIELEYSGEEDVDYQISTKTIRLNVGLKLRF